MSKMNLHTSQEMNVLYCQETLEETVNVRKRDCLSKNGRWVRDDFACCFLTLAVNKDRQGSTNDLFFSVVLTVCCSLFLSDLVAETNEIAIDVHRLSAC